MNVIHDELPVGAPWACVERPREDQAQPALQVRRVDEATFLLRQGCKASWEAPVFALLLGSQRALLLDTGAVADPAVCPVRETVDALIESWRLEKGLQSVPLIVAHTHGHNDHTKGDAQFAAREDTTMLGTSVEETSAFFDIHTWPEEVVSFDLGDRKVHMSGAPGHDARSIVVIDPKTRVMFSGDTAYPGRLYAQDLEALRITMRRLIQLAEKFGVEQVIGCHVERDRSGNDFLPGARFHDDEHPLPLTPDDLCSIEQTLMRAKPKGVTPGEPMSVFAGKCIGPMTRLALRGVSARASGRA